MEIENKNLRCLKSENIKEPCFSANFKQIKLVQTLSKLIQKKYLKFHFKVFQFFLVE